MSAETRQNPTKPYQTINEGFGLTTPDPKTVLGQGFFGSE